MKKPKNQVWIKFALLCLILFAYFAYLTYKYNLLTGGVASALTWSFFVLCTPVADAGFLLDFPLRLLFGIRMVVSEVAVWVVAILINIVAFYYFRDFYQTTTITRLMEAILTTPFPYWFIIALSAIGTFLSIHFGDELMDVIHHKDREYFHAHHFKHEMVVFVFFLVVIFGYYELISSLGISLTAI
ncbi:MAG: hypothetical protein HOE03_02980 [Nitrosomonadales bacterium]|jgi:hypothetical protein|nr:hypothetical protein [Nitrosomonadales bacterium]